MCQSNPIQRTPNTLAMERLSAEESAVAEANVEVGVFELVVMLDSREPLQITQNIERAVAHMLSTWSVFCSPAKISSFLRRKLKFKRAALPISDCVILLNDKRSETLYLGGFGVERKTADDAWNSLRYSNGNRKNSHLYDQLLRINPADSRCAPSATVP